MKRTPRLLMLLLFALYGCVSKSQVDKQRIDRITGVEFPMYEVTDIQNPGIGLNGDYDALFHLEFNELPGEAFYKQIDKKISLGDTCWCKDGNEYRYYIFWGASYGKVPEGEDPRDERYLGITIEKGEKHFTIRDGAW